VKRYPGRLVFIATWLSFAGAATGQPPARHITPNLVNADFANLVEAVSVATGKTFIIDPRVRARVTMLASRAMSPAAFYDSFLALLPICGFVAIPDGNVVKILPKPKAPSPSQMPPPLPPPRLIEVGLNDFSSVSCVSE
jgi:general secretion pathway protein D